MDRINTAPKYSYDRHVHFRDCIFQFQGAQNYTIAAEVYSNLQRMFAQHHLLVDGPMWLLPISSNRPDPVLHDRSRNITKTHISMFLKKLQDAKHYEDIHLLHMTFKGVVSNNVSRFQSTLLADVDQLTMVYDREFKHWQIERKNFINTQYILYQLLHRQCYPRQRKHFTVLKTLDRKAYHDYLCCFINCIGT